MTSIVFVDDEPIVLRALERGLRVRARPWKTTFVTSGHDALALLEREVHDIIVSDISMPEMDGVTLLEQVRARYPGMARLALSGEARTEARLRAATTAHQWLAKPYPVPQLVDTIEHLCWCRALVDHGAWIELIGAVGSLPSPPLLYQQLREALAHGATEDAVVRLVEADPAVSTKLLQMVNSAFFDEPERVTRVRRAVTLLGVDRLRELLLAAEVLGARPRATALATRSVAVAARARSLASLHADDAFLAGLLHQVGELAVECAAGEPPVLRARLGALLLGTWGLPHDIVQAVAFHRDPAAAPDPADPRLVALASAVAELS